jgi:hypothetical protein
LFEKIALGAYWMHTSIQEMESTHVLEHSTEQLQIQSTTRISEPLVAESQFTIERFFPLLWEGEMSHFDGGMSNPLRHFGALSLMRMRLARVVSPVAVGSP